MGTRWTGKKRSIDPTQPELEVSYGEGESAIVGGTSSVLLQGEAISPRVEPLEESESSGETTSLGESGSLGEERSSRSKDTLSMISDDDSVIEDPLSTTEGNAFSSSDESETSVLSSSLLSPSPQIPFNPFFLDSYAKNPHEEVVITTDLEVSPNGATYEASTAKVKPPPLSTASSRKLAYLTSSPTSSIIDEKNKGALKGYRIFSVEKLEEIFDQVRCRVYHSDVVLSENMGS